MSHQSIENRFGQVFWESPANIALVKYWGKLQGQIPMNPSLSFTLRESVVRIAMQYQKVEKGGGGLRAFTLNGQPNEKFQDRIGNYIESMKAHYAFLDETTILIESQSTFPHSAGIASSAAAFSALALALGSIECELNCSDNKVSGFLRRASIAARLGSGSACRSVYGGFTVWGKSGHLPGSSNEFAIKLPEAEIHPVFSNIHDAVLIVDDTQKKVSSTAGHALMNGHDFRESRIAQAEKNLGSMIQALKTGNEELFVEIVENEALTLHGLMLSSSPGYILIKPGTINLIEKIRQFRYESKINLCFTLDAGPNIHLIYPAKNAEKVRLFIGQELLPFCKNRQWINDGVGAGPVQKQMG